MNEQNYGLETPTQKQNDPKRVILIAVLGILIIAVFGFFLWQNSKSGTAMEEQVADLQEQMEAMKKGDKNITEEKNNELNITKQDSLNNSQIEIKGWKKYENQELGISFSYPQEWGEIKEAKFDQSGKVEYFVFSKIKSSQLGGLHKNYWDNNDGRGGSLIDSGGFRLVGGKIFYKKSNEEFGKNTEADYDISESSSCVYSTNLLWFGTPDNDGLAYHAVCNLNNEKVPAFNFAFGGNTELVGIQKEDFTGMIESVVIN